MTSLVWSPANVVACVAGELSAMPEDIVQVLSDDFDALTLFRQVVKGEKDLEELVGVVSGLV